MILYTVLAYLIDTTQYDFWYLVGTWEKKKEAITNAVSEEKARSGLYKAIIIKHDLGMNHSQCCGYPLINAYYEVKGSRNHLSFKEIKFDHHEWTMDEIDRVHGGGK